MSFFQGCQFHDSSDHFGEESRMEELVSAKDVHGNSQAIAWQSDVLFRGRELDVQAGKIKTVRRLLHADISSFKVEEYSNRVANYFMSRGFRKGDTVALFMENRPEYVATWIGLSKIGVIPALINYNLKQKALIHSMQVAKCKAIIYGSELSQGS